MKKGKWNLVSCFANWEKNFFSMALLFLFILSVSSCGQKVKDLKKASLSFNLGTTDQLLKGGVYLYGEDVLSNRFFSRGIDGGTTEVELDLPSGRWRFFAIGWEGNNIMEGTNRCASVGFDEPIFISSYGDFTTYFGGVSAEKYTDSQIPKYELSYIAKSYLQQLSCFLTFNSLI